MKKKKATENPALETGLSFRSYSVEELESMTKVEIVRVAMDYQDTLKEAFRVLKEQERMFLLMQEQINLNQQERYGKRSEKSSQLKGEPSVSTREAETDDQTRDELPQDPPEIQEAETDDQARDELPQDPPKTEEESGGEEKKKPKRGKGCVKDILKELPVHKRDIRLSPEELKELFGTDQVKEGPERIYRTCRYIPGFWYVDEVHVHPSVNPRDGSFHYPAMAGDVKPYAKSYYSNELFAFVFDQRFSLAIPFYRIERWLWMRKLYIHRQPLAQWAVRLDRKLFSALVSRMWFHLLRCGSIQIDESPAIVNEVRKKNHAPSALCYMWQFRTSEMLADVPEIILFHFDESRGTEVLEECLAGYEGTITTDGHSPYHGFAEKSGGKVTNAGCLNHSRTRFVRVIRANPQLRKLSAKDQKKVPAFHILELFGEIFHKDGLLAKEDPEKRRKEREENISKYFEELSSYINSFGENDFDKSGLMYDAIQYFKNQKPYLEGFLHDPFVPNNNSACERGFVGYSILRNNIKFIDSLDGAGATADLYSLAATAKAHGIDFYSYILYVLNELPPVLKGRKPSEYQTMEELDAFMPWSECCKVKIAEGWEKRKKMVLEGNLFPEDDSQGLLDKAI